MTIDMDHKKWKKDHKKWLMDQKKLSSGQKQMLRSINYFENIISDRVKKVKQLTKTIKKHEKMMSKGKSKHSGLLHNKFKNAHRKQNLQQKLQLKAHQDLMQINKAIQNAIKRFRRI